MYKILLLGLNEKEELKFLSDSSVYEHRGFYIAGSSDRITLSYSEYDVVIASKEAGLTLLRTVKSEQLPAVILCSENEDFEAARQGIVLRAYDYIAGSNWKMIADEALLRLKTELNGSSLSAENLAERIIGFFEARDDSFYSFLQQNAREFRTRGRKCSEKGSRVFSIVRSSLFTDYQWLDLYIGDKIFRTAHSAGDIPAMLMTLFSEFCELYPRHNSQLEELIWRILLYPDGDLKQKTLSAELRINSTYLSTVFLAQTGLRFVDYINTVKLKRAAMLLLDTDLSVNEIAARLDYKDNSYFSKLFRSKYGVTPSLFRLPPDHDFQI
ncbi:MAG: helix-turn-helix transcriptional regulator [Ruminococcus sp.]|nr:helix-turn-helix transcriptional regulator [Ruminococcus sp.]